MRRDPHDDLLLTNRPTTVVTQATSLLDSAPEMYGSAEDEEFIFAGVAADDGDLDNQSAAASARAGTMARVPGIAPEGTVQLSTPMSAPAQSKIPGWVPFAAVGLLVAVVFFGGKKRA